MEKLYTVEEVAELASVTGRTIRNYLKSGRLVGRKIGGQWRFPENEVQRLLNGGGLDDADFVQEPARPAAPSSDYNTLVDPGDYRAPVSAPASPSAAQPTAPAQDAAAFPASPAAAPVSVSAPAGPPLADAPAPEPLPSTGGQPFDLRLTLPFEEWLDAGGPAHATPSAPEPSAPFAWPGQAAVAQPAPSAQPSAPVQPPAQAAVQQPFNQPAPYGAPQPAPSEPPAQQAQPVAGVYYQPQPQAPVATGMPQAPQGYYPLPQAAQAYPPYPQIDAEQGYLPYYPYPYYYYPFPASQPQIFSAPTPTHFAAPDTHAPRAENAPLPEIEENKDISASQSPLDKISSTGSLPAGNLAPVRSQPHLTEDLQPEFSDVGLRVTKFISEVHDCSRGPMVCAVVDMHQTIATARATSGRLADIAAQESEGGQLCQSFVEFDERYYIARYTMFGTSAFLYRCLKLIG